MQIKIVSSIVFAIVFLSSPVFADEVPFPKVIMLVAGSPKSLFIEGKKYAIKYVRGDAAIGEFCLSDDLGASQCYKMKKQKGDEISYYDFCFSTGECITFKMQEFNEKYLNIQTTKLRK